MFTIIQFDRNWMLSRHARRRFLILSALSLVLGVLFFLTMHPAFFEGKRQSAIANIVAIIVCLPAVSGGLIMFLGMEWYCLEVDTSRKSVRLLRAFMLLCTMPFGQIVYYFLIYRPQTAWVEMKIV
jgi:hypothetical protein